MNLIKGKMYCFRDGYVEDASSTLMTYFGKNVSGTVFFTIAWTDKEGGKKFIGTNLLYTSSVIKNLYEIKSLNVKQQKDLIRKMFK